MERQKRSASKVTDFHKFHLSGDLDQIVQGQVSRVVGAIESPQVMEDPTYDEDATPEQLQELLKEQKESSARMQQQVEAMKLGNELEHKRLQQEQWALALQQLKLSREKLNAEHEENMARIRNLSKDREQANGEAVQWLHSQLNKDQSLQGEGPNSSQREEPSPRQIRVEQLQRQQEELQKQIEDLMVGDCSSNTTTLNTLKQTLGAAKQC